jgi:hypothetical protein
MNRTTLVTIALFSFLLSSCSKVEFPELRVPPDANSLPGTYLLNSRSAERLMDQDGYRDISASIELKANYTFEAKRMPHEWLDVFMYKSIRGTNLYDNCSGTWVVERNRYGVYSVLLYISDFSADSAFAHGEGYKKLQADVADQRKRGSTTNLGAVWGLGITGLTKSRKEYGLAVPLNHGDHGYIIFDKRS